MNWIPSILIFLAWFVGYATGYFIGHFQGAKFGQDHTIARIKAMRERGEI